jgi:hypothetical protein
VSFLYPLFLAGGLAIAIPIALHLLRRDVAPEIPFTAVRLLRHAPLEQTRRRRLRDLLLLIARVAALLLLAVAFARPYFAVAAGVPALRIVAVDRSFSMGAPGRFEQAKTLAREAAGSTAAGQQVAVIAFDDRATVVAAPGGPGAARGVIDDLKAGSGGTRFGPLFARAQELAGSSPAQLVIVSDLQRAGWSEAAPPTIAPGIDVTVRQVAEIKGNLAIRTVRRAGDSVLLTIANAGSVAASGTAHLSIDRQEQASVPFKVGAASTADVAVRFRAPERGVLTASIDDAAGFQADNSRLLLLDASSRPRATIVSGADGEAGFYVARALQSVEGDDGFEVDERTATSLAGVSNEQLARSGVVVLLSTRGLDRTSRDSLAAYVRDGGGLFVAASPDVEASVLATTMGWRGFSAVVQPEPAGVLAPVDLRHPIFRPFGALAVNLGEGHFDRTWTLRAEGWDVLARFTSGAAALIEKREGKGRVVLFASDLSRRWNDFPLNPAFVPFAVETVRHTAASADGRREYVVADVPQGVIPEPGVYELAGRRIVVNVDSRESAPAAMSAADFTKLLEPADAAPSAPADVQARQVESRQNLWRYGLLLMMLALVAESLVGRPMRITGV